MTVYVNETITLPYPGKIVQRCPVNISIVAGNDAITLILYDSRGASYSFNVDAGQKMQQENFDLFRFEVTGTGQAAIAVSYPETIYPSIEVSLNPNIPQSVTSPQLPKNLDSDGNLMIRYLSSLDSPYRSWNLGSSDVPGRGWTLGSSDTPNRSWALGTGDTPGRSWTLSSSDIATTLSPATIEISNGSEASSTPPDITVPSGYKWRVLSATLSIFGASSAVQALLYIERQGIGKAYAWSEGLVITASATDATGTGNVTGLANPNTGYSSTTQTTWQQYPILFGGDVIAAALLSIDVTVKDWYWFIVAEQTLLSQTQ